MKPHIQKSERLYRKDMPPARGGFYLSLLAVVCAVGVVYGLLHVAQHGV
ncbi:hypothetical protein [Cupriavidus agavae]|uniref:Uncharacterized protein n=1 Tax=Cupriavidus agavae TaxID=1001822 RepID=A0A4Q7RTB3_9BURK|nr:hypothetical protein [Cupriavidus agavae]RZT36896.1 hypothetical protein EV147_3560 [Cupriavidus agavae]